MKFRFVDWFLFLPTLWLSFLSSVILFSYRTDVGMGHAVSITIGLAAFIAMYFFPVELFKRYYLLFSVVGVTLLVITLIFGDRRGGATRWISLGFFGFQPGEVVKVIYVFVLAYVFTIKQQIQRYSYAFGLCCIYFLLVALQPDLDTALTFGVVFLLLFFYHVPFWRVFVPSIAVLLIVLAVITPLAWRYFLKDYQRERVMTFLQPSRDPLGSGYHAAQALISVGRGGFSGTGIGKGTQFRNNFLPEHTTDFAFASVAEELGFLGGVSIIGCLGILLWRLIWFAQRVGDLFVKGVCVCIAGLLTIHMVMNIGMNIGIMPVMGITLPFVSYGGSSLIAFFTLLGYVSAQYVAWQRYS